MTTLRSEDVDVAIIAGDARLHSGPSMSRWSERIVAAVSARHPLSNVEVVDWSDLEAERLLLSQWERGPGL